ncbi:MAG: cyclodeaminase/cyclohydrolase family protein [Chloroflexota bacterium]|nr:cyclodeaminase/cyclohydrolase family protein [Chloroflexota bacterium]
MRFSELSIDDFAGRLASGESTPGGGAAAALMAVLSASLVQMVCNHTLGRAKYAGVEERVAAIQAEAEQLGSRAGELMDADAEAFQGVSAAFKIPKDDPTRAGRISQASKAATEVPLAVIRAAERLSALGEEIGRIGNHTLGTDARTALVAAQAAASASNGNVQANRSFITDAGWAAAACAEAERLLERIRARL